MPKLHGLERSKRKCFQIDFRPAVVTDPAWSSIALGDTTRGRESEAWQLHGFAGRENDPLLFVDHINEFFL